MGTWDAAPALAADPSNSGIVVALETGTDSGDVATFNTSGSTVDELAQGGYPGDCENPSDLAIVPGGADFILACGSEAESEYSTASISAQGNVYDAGLYPDAVALDSAADVAAGSSVPNNGGPNGPDLYVYPEGSTTPANGLNVNIPYNGELMPRGLAWLPDGSELFAVVTATYVGPTTYTLETVSNPTVTRSTLTLSGPSSAYLTRTVTLTGTLSLSVGSPPGGTTITVTRTLAGSSATKTFTVTAAASGSYELTDSPAAAGKYTYTASYAGTATIASASAAQTITVSKLPVALSVSAAHTKVAYNSVAHLTIHLGTTYTSRTVLVYVHDLSKPRAVLWRKVTVSRKGTLAFSYRVPHTTDFLVTFQGDAHYAARTVQRTITVPAAVSEYFTGYYGTSGKYYLFHSDEPLYAHATVRPNKHGECVMFESQEYVRGVWQSSGTFSCLHLSKASTVVGKIGLGEADHGYPYRIRADYVRKASDRSNASNDSAWVYLEVES